jgi:hypothetical protein
MREAEMDGPIGALARFLRSEHGAISVEAAILLPVLILFYLATYTFFDAYRREATMTKASYAVSDLISRRTIASPAFLEGLHDVLGFATGFEDETWLRVTIVERDGGTIRVGTSYATGGHPALDRASLSPHLHRLPPMEDGEVLTLLEVVAEHAPAFDIGLPPRRTHTMIATPQRQGGQLAWDPSDLPIAIPGG